MYSRVIFCSVCVGHIKNRTTQLQDTCRPKKHCSDNFLPSAFAFFYSADTYIKTYEASRASTPCVLERTQHAHDEDPHSGDRECNVCNVFHFRFHHKATRPVNFFFLSPSLRWETATKEASPLYTISPVSPHFPLPWTRPSPAPPSVRFNLLKLELLVSGQADLLVTPWKMK
jgi:hypothetical protein